MRNSLPESRVCRGSGIANEESSAYRATSKRISYEGWWSYRKHSRADTKFLEWILHLLPMEDRSILLDVGCGTGGLIELAAEVGGFAVGVDFSLESLTAIKSNEKRIEKVLSDAHNLPFRSESFDRLYCSGSLEHFESASRAVLEMSRVVRKQGGRCLVFVPNSYFLGHVFMVMRTGEPPDEGGQVFAERFGTKMEWYRLLETSGLRVTSVHKFNRIWGSRKVGLFMRVIYNLLLRPFLPSNLSYGWAFICESHSNPVLDGD